MQGGSLYNPGFLGEHFNWWVGQVADDSTWRDNIAPGKYKDPNSIPGWGYRYKVRIIGLHDQGEDVIPSNQLPWVQVMYPVTAGGGQAAAFQTPNIRQGNMVFGFFLDGKDKQVPVIMGILGNNSQTQLATEIGTNRVTNDQPGSLATSGYAEGQVSKPSAQKEQIPDEGLSTKKPGPSESVKSPNVGGATIESPAAVHQQSVADVKAQALREEAIPLLKAGKNKDKIASAIKAIQTTIEKVAKKVTKYLGALQNYLAAATNVINQIQKFINDAACIIAKYLQIIFNILMEYILKQINKALTKIVAALPVDFRSLFVRVKEIILQLITCLYNKITDNLCGLIQGILNDALGLNDAVNNTRNAANNGEGPCNRRTTSRVGMCYAEELIGRCIASTKNDIDQLNEDIVDQINSFLNGIKGQLGAASSALGDAISFINGIVGGLGKLLSFQGLTFSLFGCDLDPSKTVSDKYTFEKGGKGNKKPNLGQVIGNALKQEFQSDTQSLRDSAADLNPANLNPEPIINEA